MLEHSRSQKFGLETSSPGFNKSITFICTEDQSWIGTYNRQKKKKNAREPHHIICAEFIPKLQVHWNLTI